jgi:predicted membrane metal-binding protein
MARKALELHEDLRREREIVGSSDRSFGLTFAGFFTILGALSWWRGGEWWPWLLAVAGLFAVIGLAVPRILAPANKAWLKLGLLLFRVVNPVVMFVLYATTIVPMGLVMRLAGRDPLRLRFDPSAPSYWIPREPPGPPPESMTNQF